MRGEFMTDNNQQNTSSPYVGAPYNFVPFHNKIVKLEQKQMEIHDKLQDDLISGEITYKITAQTPVFIDDGETQSFVKDEYGRIVIPGSSMRGLIRNNAQILGLAGFSDDIEDYQLMYRTIANGTEKRKYQQILGNKPLPIKGGKNISVLTEVQAGYIKNENGKLIIYKTDVDRINKELGKANYYVVNERIISEDLSNYPFFENHPECTQYSLRHPFKKIGNTYQGKENKDYRPFYHEISYEIKDLKRVVNIGEPGVYSKEGYLMGSGFMKNKKALYVIPRINYEKECIEIMDADKKSFQIDYEKRKNSLKGQQHKNVEFFNIPKESEMKPVFYVEMGGRTYFGFTPRLRLFYEHSVKEGYTLDDYPLSEDEIVFDYAKSLFGTSKKNQAFRSKVSFADAVVIENKGIATTRKLILAEPKPTSYGDYLVQEGGKDITYNNSDFQLRGIKQYWLREKIENITTNDNNDNVGSVVNPLKEGTQFKGKVRFQNLTGAELGLLLWSIELTPNSMMNIGKGKAYGLGVIKLSDVVLQVVDYAKAYNLDSMIDFSPLHVKDSAEYVKLYKDEINSKLEGMTIDKMDSIKTFFMMKERIPSGEKIRYMEISHMTPSGKVNEFSQRLNNQTGLTPLPYPKDIVGAQTQKQEITDGSENEAKVMGHEGKKIKFLIGGNYPKVPIENIIGIPDLNKKNMKEKLPKDSIVKLRYFKDGDTDKYEVVL